MFKEARSQLAERERNDGILEVTCGGWGAERTEKILNHD